MPNTLNRKEEEKPLSPLARQIRKDFKTEDMLISPLSIVLDLGK